MSSLNIVIPFLIGQNEALRRVKNLIPEIQKEHANDLTDFEETWDGYGCKFSFRGMGLKIIGELQVRLDELDISVKIPFPASLASGKIEEAIKNRASRLLS